MADSTAPARTPRWAEEFFACGEDTERKGSALGNICSEGALPLLNDLVRFSAPQLDSGLVLSKTDKSRDFWFSFHTCCCVLPLPTACLHLVALTRALPLPHGGEQTTFTFNILNILLFGTG